MTGSVQMVLPPGASPLSTGQSPGQPTGQHHGSETTFALADGVPVGRTWLEQITHRLSLYPRIGVPNTLRVDGRGRLLVWDRYRVWLLLGLTSLLVLGVIKWINLVALWDVPGVELKLVSLALLVGALALAILSISASLHQWTIDWNVREFRLRQFCFQRLWYRRETLPFANIERLYWERDRDAAGRFRWKLFLCPMGQPESVYWVFNTADETQAYRLHGYLCDELKGLIQDPEGIFPNTQGSRPEGEGGPFQSGTVHVPAFEGTTIDLKPKRDELVVSFHPRRNRLPWILLTALLPGWWTIGMLSLIELVSHWGQPMSPGAPSIGMLFFVTFTFLGGGALMTYALLWHWCGVQTLRITRDQWILEERMLGKTLSTTPLLQKSIQRVSVEGEDTKSPFGRIKVYSSENDLVIATAQGVPVLHLQKLLGFLWPQPHAVEALETGTSFLGIPAALSTNP